MTTPYLDTSALAKWYLNEAFSVEVEEYLSTLSSAAISTLTRVELCCMLARRRRSQEISPQLEAQIWGRFQGDIREGHLHVLPLQDEHLEAALELLDSLTAHALRTLDALHLAVVRSAGLQALVTADRALASAAEELGLEVAKFFPPPAAP